MNKYMTDLLDMHLSNKKLLYYTLAQYVEDCVENNEEESAQLSIMMDNLRTMFDVLTRKRSEQGCFHNDILEAAKGQIDYLSLARKYIAQYKDGGM